MLMEMNRPDVKVVGFEGTHDFTVEINAVMFRAAIDGVYSDKIRAPVREYCTNAYDGHVRAGKADIPFDVQLPTDFEPIFKVRDYGAALTRDQVLNLFTRLYASDKRVGNNEVGGIGIGCKSAFAYTSQFTVRVWLNGEMSTYICFIGEQGFPKCTVQPPLPSIEPDGVEIQFPVKRTDIQLFKAAAEYTFQGFDPKPNLLNETIKLTYPEVLMEGPGYTIVKDSLGLRAKQGCVIYPINASVVTNRYNDAMWGLSMIVDFPVGSLTVATSREALGNDERTKANIIAQIDKIREKLKELLQKRVDSEPDYIGACKLRYKNQSNYNSPEQRLWSAYGEHLTYKGVALVRGFDIKQEDFQCAYLSQRTLKSDFPCPMFNGNPNKSHYLSVEHHDDTLIVWEPPDTKFPGTRMRTVVLDYVGDYDNILWVRAGEFEFNVLMDSLHHPAHISLADVEPTKQTKQQRAATVRKLPTTSWVPGNYRASGAQSLDANLGGVYVVKLDRTSYRLRAGAGSISHYSFQQHLVFLKEAEVAPDRVWCFTKNHEKLKTMPGWVSLEDHVTAELKKKVNVSAYLAQQSLKELPNDQSVCFLRKCASKQVKMPSVMTDFLAKLDKELQNQPYTQSGVLRAYREYFPNELEKLQVKASPLLADLVAIKNKWPLIDVLGRTYHDVENRLVEHYINLIP